MENKINQPVKSPITFHIYRKDGTANPDIKQSFLDRKHLSAQDAIEGSLTLDDQTKWQLVLEAPVQKKLKEQDAVLCIISFQVRQSGNYAVARLFDQTRQKVKRS